jgi:hypothetical protein
MVQNLVFCCQPLMLHPGPLTSLLLLLLPLLLQLLLVHQTLRYLLQALVACVWL